jgi:hypothetical protein
VEAAPAATTEAALHYARVTKAANETHGDCLRIITRAEMRMADELDKKPSAQGQRTDIRQTSAEVATLDELGLDHRRVSEWRDIRADVEQEAGAIGEDVAELAADLIIANPASANRSLKSGRRGVDGYQQCFEVCSVAHGGREVGCFASYWRAHGTVPSRV